MTVAVVVVVIIEKCNCVIERDRERALKQQIKQKKMVKTFASHASSENRFHWFALAAAAMSLIFHAIAAHGKKSHFITPWKMSWNRNCQKISAISYQNHTLVIMDFQCRWWKSHGHDDNERATRITTIFHRISSERTTIRFGFFAWTTHERCAHSIIFALLFQPDKLVDDFESSRKFEVEEIYRLRGRNGRRTKGDGNDLSKVGKKSCVTWLLVWDSKYFRFFSSFVRTFARLLLVSNPFNWMACMLYE